MYPIDLTTYFPELASIPQADLASARSMLVQWLEPYFADTDMSYGSVMGDRGITPLSAALAAMNIALGRVMSDMIPGNVAAGTIYSCDFVSKFLGNFGVYDLSPVASAGVVRMIFSADLSPGTTLNIDSAVMFQFGSFVYRVAAPATVLPSGSDTSLGSPLRQLTASSWAVDLNVTGVNPGSVAIGTAGASNVTPANLISITAATPLTASVTPASLVALAKLTQRSVLTANATPAGLESFVLDRISGGLSADVITPGDGEFAAAGGNAPTSWNSPDVVMFYRSATEMTPVTQDFVLTWDPTIGPFVTGTSGARKGAYAGEVPFLYPPDKITALSWAPDSSVDISPYVGFRTTGARGSIDEAYRMIVEYVPSASGLGNAVVGTGVSPMTATFSVTYLCDPTAKHVSSILSAREFKPVGYALKVVRPVTAWIDTAEIHYVRSPGTSMNLEQARQEISAYLNGCHSPQNLSESHIVDAMRWAGAAKVNSINLTARLSQTAADLERRTDGITTSVVASIDQVELSPSSRSLITESYSFGTQYFPFTSRTRRYSIDPAVIVFKEDA